MLSSLVIPTHPQLLQGAAKNSGDPTAQQNLQDNAVELRNITNSTATAVLKKRAVRKLEIACRHACTISTQLIAAAQGGGTSNTNESSQQQLMAQCKVCTYVCVVLTKVSWSETLTSGTCCILVRMWIYPSSYTCPH